MDEAHALVEQVPGSAPTDGDAYDFIGEAYESGGDLRQARRWFSLGVTHPQRLIEGGEDDELVGPPPAKR